MLKKEEVVKIVERNGLEDSWVEKLLKMNKEVVGGKRSKSSVVVELSGKMFRGDIGKVVGCSYNMVYNIEDNKGLVGRKKDVGDGSKSEKIKVLLKKGYSVRGVVEEFMKEGMYVNMNMVYGVRKKMVKKGELEVSK